MIGRCSQYAAHQDGKCWWGGFREGLREIEVVDWKGSLRKGLTEFGFAVEYADSTAGN